MIAALELILPTVFGFAAVLYLWLAVRISRVTAALSNNTISYFLFLIGTMVAGSAFSFGTTDENIYGIGRTLSYFSGSFIPLAMYTIYREFTAGRPTTPVLLALSIIPAATTALAITNPLHGMIWTTIETGGVYRFTDATDHAWFTRVHAPFAYGLFGYSVIALAGRLPSIALAHRRKVVLLLICASLPFLVSIANTLLGIGPADFPFTSTTLALLLPLYWYATIGMRVYDFSPLAYETMFDHVRDPIIVLDQSQKIISANRPAQKLLESAESELIGNRLWQDDPEAQAILEHARDRKLTQTIRLKSDRYYELNTAPLTGPSGQSRGTVVVCRDVTQRKQALAALADSENLIRSLVEHSSNGMLRFTRDSRDDDKKFRCTFANRSAEQFLGSGNATLVGMPVEKLHLLQPEKLLETFESDDPAKRSVDYEIEIDVEDEQAWLRIVAEPVGSDYSVTLIDITQRKRNETRALADALRDPLTGVWNRRGFEKQARHCFGEDKRGAVIYLDLNNFKTINDRFGHHAGDALLKAFGHRLEFCLRPEDILARLGGDEFVIVLPDIAVEDAKRVAERLVESACQAYIIQGQEIDCVASFGIALMPDHGNEMWQLVSVADRAMYKVKDLSDEAAANDRAAYVEKAIAS
ncbi:MAG: diguanylate cyclase [Woeseiaceae bacterium]|nr:diguanylate cyclase [Woeseiaceae bacterium]